MRICARLEDKLGIHASPTARMVYGDGYPGSGLDTPGAIGWLIGEENRGLNCMFTMMNNARLMVGVQAVGVAECATQRATAYALERRQGNAAGQGPAEGGSPIIEHPDVRRMLLAMRGKTAASRALCHARAHAIDKARDGTGEQAAKWQARAELLTPLAKAFSSDCAVEVASLGVQVHGGMGYIEETGAAQHLRDARIAPIYEGTNGVQAIDLVTRKLPLAGGDAVREMIADLRAVADQVTGSNRPELGTMGDRIGQAVDDLETATRTQLQRLADGTVETALAGATPYLQLFGIAAGSALLGKGALATASRQSGDQTSADRLRIATACGFAAQQATLSAGLRTEICEDSDAVLAASADLFGAVL